MPSVLTLTSRGQRQQTASDDLFQQPCFPSWPGCTHGWAPTWAAAGGPGPSWPWYIASAWWEKTELALMLWSICLDGVAAKSRSARGKNSCQENHPVDAVVSMSKKKKKSKIHVIPSKKYYLFCLESALMWVSRPHHGLPGCQDYFLLFFQSGDHGITWLTPLKKTLWPNHVHSCLNATDAPAQTPNNSPQLPVWSSQTVLPSCLSSLHLHSQIRASYTQGIACVTVCTYRPVTSPSCVQLGAALGCVLQPRPRFCCVSQNNVERCCCWLLAAVKDAILLTRTHSLSASDLPCGGLVLLVTTRSTMKSDWCWFRQPSTGSRENVKKERQKTLNRGRFVALIVSESV